MRFFTKLSITQKLTVIVMTTTLAALVIACSLLFCYDVVIQRQSLKDRVTLSAKYVANELGDPIRRGNQGRAEEVLNMLSQNDRILAACLYDAQGNPIARYFRDQRRIDFPQAPPMRPEMHFSKGALHVFHPIQELNPIKAFLSDEALNQTIGTLYILTDTSNLRYRIVIYALAVFCILLMSSLLAYLLSTRLQRAISGPITHLAVLAKTVSDEKDYSLRARKHSDDEIGNLVDEFNEMLAQIEKQDRALQEAHDQLEERVTRRTRELQREIAEHKRTAANLQQEIKIRKNTETALQNARQAAETASRFKGEFLANMSHEIRTPMNGIIGMTELLLSTELSAAQCKYAETIRRSGRSLLKIIGDILDYSKVEAGQLAIEPIPFDLQVACEDVVELLSTRSEEKAIALVLRFAPECPRRVIGDAGRIRQVLTNLAANAIKFTHDGHVLIDVEATGRTADKVAIRVSVEDTGIGTPQDKLNAIFGQYTQADPVIAREYGGTGLGLAISKQLVELMGGAIGVESREGHGSRFHFTLVLPLDAQAPLSAQPRTNLAGVRVLVVDHSVVNRRVVLEQMASWRMRADAVGSSTEALKYLRDAAAVRDPYRIALIDDQMPGVRGESLGRTVKGEQEIHDTLLVLITSLGQRGDAQRMVELGFSGYLTRPIRQSELMDALATIWSAHLSGEPIGLVTRHTIAESRDSEPALASPADTMLGARVLVAEDNAVNQQVAREILQSFDCTITLANDGHEALECVRNGAFDVILMDCQMPRMDGYAATAEIRQSQGPSLHTPIIAMTAHAMKGDRERCLAAGMDDYVSKPITPEGLLEVLCRWLPAQLVARQPNEAEEAHVKDAESSSIQNEASEEPALVLDIQKALWVTGGKVAIFRRIAMVFVQHMPTRVAELQTAFRQGDRDEVARLAHSIKGASASVGGQRLRQVAAEVEVAIRDGDQNALDGRCLAVAEEFQKLRDAIEHIDWDELAPVGYSSTPSSEVGASGSV